MQQMLLVGVHCMTPTHSPMSPSAVQTKPIGQIPGLLRQSIEQNCAPEMSMQRSFESPQSRWFLHLLQKVSLAGTQISASVVLSRRVVWHSKCVGQSQVHA